MTINIKSNGQKFSAKARPSRKTMSWRINAYVGATRKFHINPDCEVFQVKRAKRYNPLTLIELMEWEFMCCKPSSDCNNPNRPLLTLRGEVDRDLDFVERYEHAYL